ncbi:hypothetical protein [Mariniluteicoccus flavus]
MTGTWAAWAAQSALMRAVSQSPGVAPSGDTFALAWDAHLEPFTAPFTIDSTDTPSRTIANCVANAGGTSGSGVITCTSTDYVETNPGNLRGSLRALARQTDVKQGAPVTVRFSDTDEADPYTWSPRPAEPFSQVTYYKNGVINPDGTVEWYVYIPAGRNGLETDYLNLVVTDTFSPPMTLVQAPRLKTTTRLNDLGTWPDYQDADPSTYAVVQNLQDGKLASFTLTAPKLARGSYNVVHLITRVDASAPDGQVYSNTANTTADGADLGNAATPCAISRAAATETATCR